MCIRDRTGTRLVSGSHTLQAYWFSGTVDRHLYLAPLTWIIEDQKWVERKDALVFDPERPPKEVSTWNGDCIQCHATGGQPRFLVDPTTQAVKVDTRVGELGIACEACHGPGHEHVLANQDPIRRYGLHFGDGQDPTIVEPRRLTQQKAMQICSVCHAVQLIADSRAFLSTGIQFRPGQETNPSQILIRALEAPSKPELAAFLSVPGAIEMRFWPDGPSRPVGREVSSLIESKCYQGGLTCLNCHSMHNGSRSKQVAPEMDTDKACASCHPDLVKDAAAHSHHRAGSSGAACSSCHMPPTTFGQMRGNRNHFIESPNPAKTLATGRPNACNVCHLDRTMAWTVEQMNAWYGTPKIELDEDERQVSATVLQLLKGDALQRAIASASLGWAPAQEASGTDWIAPYLGVLMRDSYAVVRYRAYASLRTLPGYQGFEFDYVGPVAEREQGSARVLQQWKRSAANPALLIGPDGLEQELIDRLLARRDNRSIILLE